LERGGRRLAGQRIQVEPERLCLLAEVDAHPLLAAQCRREQRRPEPDDVLPVDGVELRRSQGAEREVEAELSGIRLVVEAALAVEGQRLPREVALRGERDVLARL